MICPACCAKTRNSDCEGCIFYITANKLSKETTEMKLDAAIEQALILVEQGNVRDGETKISKLMLQHPGHFLTHYALGVVSGMKGDFEQSIVHFDKALEIEPEFAEAWFNKGTAHYRLLDVQESIIALRKAVKFGKRSEPFIQSAKTIIEKIEEEI